MVDSGNDDSDDSQEGGSLLMRRRMAALVVLAALALLGVGCGRVSVMPAAVTPLPLPTTVVTDPPLPETPIETPIATASAPATATTTAPSDPSRPALAPACTPSPYPSSPVLTQLATPDRAGLAYSATPGGPTVGHLQAPWGGPATRPVISQQGGWVEIALNTRPNGSTAWVPSGHVALRSSPYLIVISVCRRSLTLFQGATEVFSAPVGVGRPQWPTPLGATFVDNIVSTNARQRYVYGPTVLILGVHSNVFTEFDGGNGTVGIHGYPSDPASTRGVASSHGCVRVGPDTINVLKAVPVGTPVNVIA